MSTNAPISGLLGDLPKAQCTTKRPLRANERLVRIREVIHRIGVHRGTIYKWMKEGRFPHQVSLGANSSAWYESDIDAWIANPTGWCDAN